MLQKKIATLLCYLFLLVTTSAQNCVTIESILVDACGAFEIDNEMLRFRVGPNQLNIANLNMTFGAGQPFDGIQTPNSLTADKTAELNATIQSCGYLLEPIGGVLPANSKVLVVGSWLISATLNPFTNLSDTLIIIYIEQSNYPDAYFINAPGPIPPSNAQTTTISFGGGCTNSVTYLRSSLITSTGAPATATNGNGAFVNFDDNGIATYGNNGCSALVNPFSAEWTNPSPLCEGNTTINLNNYITGTYGGTWSGTGVTGNNLNLTGLSGNINITYTVNSPGCGSDFLTHTITLEDCCLPVTFNNIPISVACDANPIALMANQTGLELNEAITPCYYIQVPAAAGHTSLQVTFFENGANLGTLNVTPNTNFSGYFAYASPGANNQVQLCETFASVLAGNIPYTIRDCHSNAIITSGTWIMDGNCQTVNVTPPGTLSGIASWSSNSNGLINVEDWGSAQFSPSAAGPGTWEITYCWDNGIGCQACQTKSITVTSNNDASWTAPTAICDSQTPIDFNQYITGNSGGIWSGNGISASGNFNPSGLSGTVQLTYTVGTGSCATAITHDVNIITTPDASWTAPNTICQGQTISLDPLVTGINGGTWTGFGVSNNSFNASGLNGSIAITYTVGQGTCQAVSTQNINVVETTSASWNGPESICNSAQALNLNNYVDGTTGGVWTGQGIQGNNFNPEGLSGIVNLNYTVGVGTCSATFNATINVIMSPSAPTVSGNLNYCENQVFQALTATGAAGAEFNWYDNATLSNLISTGSVFTPNVSDGLNFWITQKIGECESPPLPITITLTPAPAPPQIDATFFYCSANELPAMTANAAGNEINWYSDPQLTDLINTGPVYQPVNDNVTNFWLTSVQNGCTSNPVQTSLIPENPVNAIISPAGPLTICQGESLVLTSNSATNNLWSTGETSQSITINTPGTYSLTVTGSCNVDHNEIVITEDFVETNFELSATTGFAPLEVAFSNNSINSSSCQWFINNNFSQELAAGTYIFNEQGFYAITLKCISASGCTDEITKTISVGASEVELYVPNSFTPNGDNLNDVFKIYGIGISYVNVQIYSRWGDLIYQWSGLEGGWDGTSSNRLVSQDIYAYVIYGIDANNNKFKKIGSITLLGD